MKKTKKMTSLMLVLSISLLILMSGPSIFEVIAEDPNPPPPYDPCGGQGRPPPGGGVGNPDPGFCPPPIIPSP